MVIIYEFTVWYYNLFRKYDKITQVHDINTVVNLTSNAFEVFHIISLNDYERRFTSPALGPML